MNKNETDNIDQNVIEEVNNDQLELNEEDIKEEAEEFQNELDEPIVVVLESPDISVVNQLVSVLRPILKIRDNVGDENKIAIVNSITCTPTAAALYKLLQENLSPHTKLLIESAILAESRAVMIGYLEDGYNVILTSYLTNLLVNNANSIHIDHIAGITSNAGLPIVKDCEIVIFTPVDAKDEERLKTYHAIITAVTESELNTVKYFQLEVDDLEEDTLDDMVLTILRIVDERIDSRKQIAKMAEKIFKEEDEEVIEVLDYNKEDVGEDDISENVEDNIEVKEE